MRIPTLVLRKFAINKVDNGGPLLEISGRPKGIIAWILTGMGLSTETHLEVTSLCLTIKSASLFGEFSNFVPLPHISSNHCGLYKPIQYLIIAAGVMIFSLITGLSQRDSAPLIVIGLIVAIVFVVAYFLSKKITLQVVTDAGLAFRLMFKPSVIEGVPVDIDYTKNAITLLNELVLKAA